MWYRVVIAGAVAFDDPLVDLAALAGESIANRGDGVIGASIRPESIGVDTKAISGKDFTMLEYACKANPPGI